MRAARQFHCTSRVLARRDVAKRMPLPRDLVEFDIEEDFPEFSGNDIPSGAHIALHQQRQLAYYMRLIENEMPKFVAFRKSFVPPAAAETPLVIRSVDYAGEEHPLTAKRTVVVPVTQLPLRDDLAIHKIKLLAGARWTPDPPKNAGVPLHSEQERHGYIKIACEDFPQPAMNLKWISDTIDELISAANGEKSTRYQDLPVDTRHVEAKVKKAKEGDHARGRTTRPSLKDFPKEWLPQLPLPPTDVMPSAHQ
ncbi:mitochondrial ribosomal subunit protein-domain-containing protein [Lanmaoa asiatica]|nr:mitochondrial ribosomal subunit protein-domain-containing protein [Lanmaoa asiatica]